METVDNQVAVINKSIEVFRSAPEILKANQERSKKALTVGQSILQQWQDAWNTEDPDDRIKALALADDRSNKYLANCTIAVTQEKEARAAITQLMDEFKKMFTSSENDIDKTKPNTVPSKVQNWRDTYAKELADIERKKRQEAEAAAAKAKAKIDYKASLCLKISNRLNAYLADKKMKMNASFNAITLEIFEQKAAALNKLAGTFELNNIDLVLADISYADARFSPREIEDLKIEVFKEYDFQSFQKTYFQEVSELKQQLIDRLPSKKAELEEIKRKAEEAEKQKLEAIEKARIAEEERQAAIAATKNKQEKERLEREAKEAAQREADRLKQMEADAEADRIRKENEVKEREEAEQIRLQQEAEERKRRSSLEIEMKKQADQTLNLFEQEAALTELTPKPEARTGYDITVTHQAGFVQIFQMWFENEGKSLSIDKMEKTSLGQMKAFCEKLAVKKDLKIDSKLLVYTETFKAVNRKAV